MVVRIRGRRTVCGHLGSGILEDIAIDTEVVGGQELILSRLHVTEEHVASEADAKSQDPADYHSNEGPFSFVFPDYEVWGWRLRNLVLFTINFIIF
jgi:hypothetical protein